MMCLITCYALARCSQAWLTNFVSSVRMTPLAIGTTNNEALHRELNNIFDNVHEIHRHVLELKLRILQRFKLLPH